MNIRLRMSFAIEATRLGALLADAGWFDVWMVAKLLDSAEPY